MSKKIKAQKVELPEEYTLTPIVPEQRHHCVVIDHNNNVSIFNSKADLEKLESFNSLIKDTIAYCWPCLDRFMEIERQTILAYHDQFFKCTPPKDQTIEVTAQYVWAQFHRHVKTSFLSATPTLPTGRKSNLLSTPYFIGNNPKPEAIITPQAKECVKIFNEAITKFGKGEPKSITEEVLRQYVVDQGPRLKTRQDPWRIFQYYRTQLINAHILRRT